MRVPPGLNLADLPLPRAVILGPQVRRSFTGGDELPCGGADADGRSGSTSPASQLHVAVLLAVDGDLAQRTPFAASRQQTADTAATVDS